MRCDIYLFANILPDHHVNRVILNFRFHLINSLLNLFSHEYFIYEDQNMKDAYNSGDLSRT